MKKTSLMRALLIFNLLIFLHSCSKDFSNSPDMKKDTEKIIVVSNLSASSSRVVIGGAQIVIQAKLSDQNNNNVVGEPVLFTTTLGSITEVDTTDGDGIAHAVLTSSNEPGAAIVKAKYKEEHSRTITVYFDSSSTSAFVFNLSQNTIIGNGEDSVLVSVTVTDNLGGPATHKPVSFSATAGHFIHPVVFTDSSGTAQNKFLSYAGYSDTTAILQATVNGINHQITVLIRGVEFSLIATPKFLIADGASKAEIIGVLKETTRQVAIPGAKVIFAANLGTIPWQGATSADGVVKVDLTSSQNLGTAMIIGYYGTGISDTTYVDFIKSEPTNMYITVDKPILPADNTSTAEIQVRVTDLKNDPIHDGMPVHFTISKGSGSIEPVKTTVNGIAKNYLTAGNIPDTTIVTIRTGVLTDSVQVVYTVGEAAFVEIKSDSTSIPADGITTTKVYAKVTDKAGNPVGDGTNVKFNASVGNITTESITVNGIAEAQFSSNITGIATLRASVGSVQDEITVYLRPGNPASILLTYAPTSLGVRDSGRNQTVRVIADVRDSKNNTVSDGTWVKFSIYASPNGGETLSSAEPVPTVNGKSEVSLLSGIRSGTVRIQAEVVDNSGRTIFPVVRAISTEIIIFSGPPYIENVNDQSTSHLTVGAKPLNILGWYHVNNTAMVTAVVGDKYNNPVPAGTAVYFTTSAGVISTYTGYTDNEGIATVTIHSAQPYPSIHRFYNTFFDPNINHEDFNLPTGIIPGPIPDFESSQVLNSEGGYGENDGIVRILATSEGVDANGKKATIWSVGSLVFSGSIHVFTVTTDKAELSPGESALITIQIYDVNGNPIVPGSGITAEVTAGRLAWTSIKTDDPGVTIYSNSLINDLDPNDPDAKEAATQVTIKVVSDNGNGVQSTAAILFKLE